jgi:hypothetical protein
MTSSRKRAFISLDDYFAMKREGAERCEYRNGEVL